MNNMLEPSRPRTGRDDARGEDSAEAAQRDLLEFLTSEAKALPLIADLVPQTELAPPSVPDDSEASDLRFAAIPDEPARPAPIAVLCDADGEACERAARTAAQAVDEATQDNLRRLEATMSWLQNEARSSHLPRAPQIAPVQGVPSVQASASAFDAIIDRSTLHRTVHGSSVNGSLVKGATGHDGAPLPIWLCEHEAPIRLPPPRRSRGLWQRLVKFFWTCAVAAPIAYVFAITTWPLHKHLADITGLAHAISLSLPAPLGQPEPLRGRDLIAIAPIVVPANGEVSSVASKYAAAAEVAMVPTDADRSAAPEAAPGPVRQGAIVTVDPGETRPQAVPADSGAAEKSAAQRDAYALTEQGKQFFESGDLVAARILFGRAAKAGDAAAAIAMGATYDPVALAEHGLRGVASDLDKARAWYERAKEMGSSEGPRRLEVLANR